MKKLIYLLLLLPIFAQAQVNGTLQKTPATKVIRGNFGASGLDSLLSTYGIPTNGYVPVYNSTLKKSVFVNPASLSTVSFGAFGSTANANGGSISAGVITLQPASASFPGGVTIGTQTFAGLKTFSSDVSVPDEAYGVGWNSSLEVPTKNALWNALNANYVPYVGASQNVNLGTNTLTLTGAFSGSTGAFTGSITNSNAIPFVLSSPTTIDFHQSGAGTVRFVNNTFASVNMSLTNAGSMYIRGDLTVNSGTVFATQFTGNSATVTTNANLTGVVTSVGNATSIADAALSIAKTSGLQTALDLKQPQLNGTGFVKATGTTISYDNSTYLTTTGSGASLTGVVHTTGNQTIAGLKTFSSTIGLTGGSTLQVESGTTGHSVFLSANLAATGSTTVYLPVNATGTLALTSSNITGSAATLTTTRTIWGQNFNGSANVSGAFSGATSGDFSGALTGTTYNFTSTGVVQGGLTVGGATYQNYAGVFVGGNTTEGSSQYAFITDAAMNGVSNFAFYANAKIRASATASNTYGLYVQNPEIGAGATLTNNYGLYIANQTSASTLNYSIYSAGGLNYLAGATTLGAVLTGTSGAFTSTLTSDGNLRVGTNNTSYLQFKNSTGTYSNLVSMSLGDRFIFDGSSFGVTFTGGALFSSTVGITGALTAGVATYSSTVTATGFFESSDLRYKDIISRTPSASGFDMIEFKWKPFLNRDNLTHYGYGAQEVQPIMPNQVAADGNGFHSVNYTDVLVKKVSDLEQRILKLEKK